VDCIQLVKDMDDKRLAVSVIVMNIQVFQKTHTYFSHRFMQMFFSGKQCLYFFL